MQDTNTNTNTNTITQSGQGILSTNRVLRNTYALLAMTLIFSGIMAVVAMNIPGLPRATGLITVVAAMGILMFVLPRFENSGAGIGLVFLATGLLGFGLGPLLSMYLRLPNGATTIATAMGGTGTIFLALSAYVLTTKKRFEFMGGMLFVGLIVVFGAAVLNIFMNIPALSIAVSSAIVLLMSGFILFDTSRIVNGGETNYIRATVSMFINIFNLFTSLLHLLGIMGDD